MSNVIVDGSGTGYKAKVNMNNRLSVTSKSTEMTLAEAVDGNTFFLTTTRMTLTSTSESAVLYVKNNETRAVFIDKMTINTASSVGTLTGAQPTLKIYENPLTGTIIDNAVAAKSINLNFGSTKTLIADLYQGAEGNTLANQVTLIDYALYSRADVPLREIDLNIILERGSSLGISYQPESGSTSVDLICSLSAIILPEDL